MSAPGESDTRAGADTRCTDAPTAELELVAFRVGEEHYAVDASAVLELARLGAITRVPHAPHFVRGVVNWHGAILPVLDLATRFGIGATELGAEARVIVIDHAGERVGLLATSGGRLTRVAPTALAAPPEGPRHGARFVTGLAMVAGAVLARLDLDRVFESDGPQQARDKA